MASLKERNLQIKDKEFVEADELGLFLGKTPNSETLDPIHHKYLRNEKNRVWLPYAYASEWKGAFNPNGTSVITNQFKRTSVDKKQSPLITIEFQYDKDWEIISSSELNQIVAWLNENTNKRNNIKTLLKLKIKQASLNYTQSKKQLDETKVKKTTTENSVKINLKAVSDTENIIKGLLAELEKAQNELAINAKNVFESERLQQAYRNQNENLKKQIQREKIAKSQIVVPDSRAISMEIATIKALILLPQSPPESFKSDYSISFAVDSANNAYSNCAVGAELDVDACKTSLEQFGIAKKNAKKLLRRFF